MAKEAMDLLHKKGYHIAIVSTQPSFENQYYTLQWLKENDIYYDTICFTNEKQIVSGHIAVDDYVNNLLNCHEKERILIDTPYNRYEKRFKRYKSLYEFVESLK
jgi:5'(3')-deoxyribonucleotidase